MKLYIVIFLFLSLPLFAAEVTPIRIQMGADPKTLEPTQVSDLAGFAIASNLVETLVRNDEKGHLINGLAKSYSISKDGLTYKFQVRTNARWSDGKAVTAEECVLGLLTTLDPKTAASDAALLFSIRGAHDFATGKAKKESVAVHASNGQLIVELEHPDAAFLMTLTMPMAAPMRAEFSEKWDFHHPTNGAYFIRAYKIGDEIDLEPNPFSQSPGQRPIVYKIVTEQLAALNLFESGKIDILTSIAPMDVKRLEAQGLIIRVPSVYVIFLSFNTKKPPFNDPDWRKAVAASIDREGLGKIVGSTMTPTSGYLPSTLDGHLDFQSLPFNNALERIRNLNEKPKIQLGYSPSAVGDLVVQKIQSDLQKKLAVAVALQGSEWKVFLSQLKTDAPQIFYEGMGAPFNDPTNHLRNFVVDPVDGENFSRYNNPKYNELVEQIARTPLGKKRTKLIQEAQRILVERDAVVVPLLERVQVFGVAKNIQHFAVNPFAVIQLSQLRN